MLRPGAARPVPLQPEEQDGPVIFPREARGRDPEDAPVPAGVGLDEHRAVAARAGVGFDARARLRDDAALETLALGVARPRARARASPRALGVALLEERQRERAPCRCARRRSAAARSGTRRPPSAGAASRREPGLREQRAQARRPRRRERREARRPR